MIVAVIVIGGGVYMGMQGSSKSPVLDTPKTLSTEGTIQGSMGDLVALGVSLKCSFTHTTDLSSSSGDVYVADGKVRGNFKVTSTPLGNQSFDAYMIADGKESYVWSSFMPQGYKTIITEPNGGESNAGQDGLDYNQTLDYTCTPWEKDVSFFVPPADVTFVDAPTASTQ